jgi:hypothetical protein
LQQDEFFGWSKSKRTPQLTELKEVEIVGDCEYSRWKNLENNQISNENANTRRSVDELDQHIELQEDINLEFEYTRIYLDVLVARKEEEAKELRKRTQILAESTTRLFKTSSTDGMQKIARSKLSKNPENRKNGRLH